MSNNFKRRYVQIEKFNSFHKDLAYSIQQYYEDAIIGLERDYLSKPELQIYV